MTSTVRVKKAGIGSEWLAVGVSASLVGLAIAGWVIKVHYFGQRFSRGKLSWAEIGERADLLLLLWIVGTCVLWLIFLINTNSSSARVRVCRDCGRPSAKSSAPRCPECQGTLEPLEGFYQRHPQHAKDG